MPDDLNNVIDFKKRTYIGAKAAALLLILPPHKWDGNEFIV